MDARKSDMSELLRQAVEVPGRINQAYSLFWSYSVGNQILAAVQCYMRGIPLGPIGTFMHWKANGRHVRKGEKAISLVMPVTCKRQSTDAGKAADPGDASADPSGEKSEKFTLFITRPHWFVLSQTEGADYTPEAPPAWDRARALAALEVTEVPFDGLSGNCQGFARKREFAVSPIAAMPFKTTFHELAHVVLGHTEERDESDTEERPPHDLREVEAESVALICLESLGLPGAEFCRGYIQHYLKGRNEIPERSAQRIFKAATQILEAGRPAHDGDGVPLKLPIFSDQPKAA